MSKLPPGPSSSVLQTWRFMRDPVSCYASCRQRYGDPFTSPMPGNSLVVTGNPEGVKQIFTADPSVYVVGDLVKDSLEPIVGPRSILTQFGDRHRRERKMLGPPLLGEKMRDHGDLMRTLAREVMSRWEPGGRYNLFDEMLQITLDVMVHVIFGIREPGQVVKFRTAAANHIQFAQSAVLFIKALRYEFLGLGPWARLQRATRELDALLYAAIAERRRAPTDSDDLMSVLLQLKGEDGGAYSDEELRDHLVTMLFAGYETTSTMLSWAFYELSQNPAALTRLQEEVDGLGSDPSTKDIESLKYADCVINETLRLHPANSEVARTLKEPFELLGWELPAGITVTAANIITNYNPDLHPEPARFRPERFEERKFTPYEFFPFGGGQRRCLGAAFAMYEAKMVLAEILPHWEFAPIPGEHPRMVLRSVILGSHNGVPMIAKKRARPRAAA